MSPVPGYKPGPCADAEYPRGPWSPAYRIQASASANYAVVTVEPEKVSFRIMKKEPHESEFTPLAAPPEAPLETTR